MIEKFANYILNKNKEYIIFDIGSRDCLQSIEFYNMFPNSKIYAFECNPNTLDICKKNINLYRDRITLIEGAVCDYDGYITFYPINQKKTITTWTDGNPGASSLFKSSGKYNIETYVQDEITTKCHRLDTIMKKYNIPKVDIIWMDLQGAELLALKGLGNNLYNVEFIHTEMCNIEIYTNQALFPEINDYLINLFYFKTLSDLNTNVSFHDVIYQKKLNDPIFSDINLTFDEQTFIRGKPKEYILHTINLFKKYTNAKVILEIGSIRNKMNHDIDDFNPSCCNDGHSTYFWKHHTNAEIHTVDIDPKCKTIINSDDRLNNVKTYTDDAIKFTQSFIQKIDLLFLDAWDVVPNSPYAEAHLQIYNILKNKLSDNCLILIDDTDIGNNGKGELIIPELLKDGFLMLLHGRQTLFIRNNIIYKPNNVYDLTKFNYNKYSQRGHDGIIKKIMKEINIKKGFFVEFGGWDGIYLSNCRNLYNNGWNGCFIEADSNKYNTLVENYKNSNVICLNKYVFPTQLEGDTVDMLHKQYLNNIDVDLLSIDIDGRDYEILENLEMKPKLIIIEGGFLFHPSVRTKIPYDEAKDNVQQPLYVMFELAKKKGYTPICFNQDSFLLRNDLYENYTYFKNIKNDCYTLWKSAFNNILSDIDRKWLIDFRNSHIFVNKYEHPYYLNLEDSLNSMFDIVIPVGPYDKEIIEKQLEFTKKNIINYRNIYLICYDPTIYFEGCITIDEKIFPFTIDTIANFHGKIDRNGWYLQQLLKLYAGIVIPNILEKYLVIDSDTFFLKPTLFIQNNKCLYNYGSEYHQPYFKHMLILNKNLIRVYKEKSGICHHMIFETKYVKELIEIIENEHNDVFYNIFLNSVTDIYNSGASEYEIYFNYMLKNHNDKIIIRELKWCNSKTLDLNSDNDYISYHWYCRT